MPAYFVRTFSDNLQLWVTDGTIAGTRLVANLGALASLDVIPYRGGVALALGGVDSVDRLLVSRGTAASTISITDMDAGWASHGSALSTAGNMLYFAVTNGSDEAELWASDGTAHGTHRLTDAVSGGPTFIQPVADSSGNLVFLGYDSTQGLFDPEIGFELWTSNGTTGGTRLVADIDPGSGSAFIPGTPVNFLVVGGSWYFFADDGIHGNELWVSDGTEAGTRLVADINPGFDSSSFLADAQLTVVGGTLYFTADDGVHGTELWASDGTAAGTRLVADIDHSPFAGSFPYELTALGNRLAFAAFGADNGADIWITDGTAAGTHMLAEPAGETADWFPIDVTSIRDELYFITVDHTNGYRLWATDGTSAGTSLVLDLPLDLAASSFDLTEIEGHLYIVADDGTGPSLFGIDPTTRSLSKLAGDLDLQVGLVEVASLSQSLTGTGNFNGDSYSDILWQNLSGSVRISELSGTDVIGGGTVGPDPGPTWHVIDSGDFNGDGKSDILFQHDSGLVSLWELDGTNIIGGAGTLVGPNPGPTWHIEATGDFSGDGKSDILFQHDSGLVSLWELNGTDVVGGLGTLVGPNPGPTWDVVGTGDFNGDGKSDILFQHDSGLVSLWELNGIDVVGGLGTLVGPNPGPTWDVVGTGDFNGDGKSDILFQHDSGLVSLWELDGTNIIGGAGTLVGPNPGPDWHVEATGDYNGDGKSDLLFQRGIDGPVSLWELDGTHVIGGVGTFVTGSAPGWIIV